MRFVPKTIVTVSFVAAASLAAAFGAGVFMVAPTNPPPPPGTPPPGVPIDGSLFVLLIAAIAFGFYKIHQIKNKKAPM